MSDKPKRWTWEEWWNQQELQGLKLSPLNFRRSFFTNEPYIEYLESIIKFREYKPYLNDWEQVNLPYVMQLEQTISKLREALEFYANDYHYRIHEEVGITIPPSSVKAQEALKECFGEENE